MSVRSRDDSQSTYPQAADYTLTARWRPGTDEPVFQLACPAAHSPGLASVLTEASV
jgi:hypothetical protein